jgi:endonuclease/exonuclease/phosphatase family metal-dependent hydrolase
MPIGHAAINRRVLAHRCDGDPILDFDFAEGDRGEEFGGHSATLSVRDFSQTRRFACALKRGLFLQHKIAHNGPMTRLRLATFNVENLFMRPPELTPGRASERRFGMFVFDDATESRQIRRAVEAALSDDERQLTGQALIDCEADIICLQEVESEAALRLFRDEYLHRTLQPRVAREIKAVLPALRAQAEKKAEAGKGWLRDQLDKVRLMAERKHLYPHFRVVAGNDGRGINIGFLSRYPVIEVKSHAHLTFSAVPGTWNEKVEKLLIHEWEERTREKGHPEPSQEDRIFRRDCLEVTFDVGGRSFTVFITHLKANPPYRELTYPMRRAEVLALRHIVQARFGEQVASAPWAICGDMNDFVEIDGDADMPDLVSGKSLQSALTELVGGDRPFAVDACQMIADPIDSWTSYFPRDDVYSQLDHILLSPVLSKAVTKVEIIRAGQPYRAARYGGPRYPRVGWDRPKASDHCPVVVELELAKTS